MSNLKEIVNITENIFNKFNIEFNSNLNMKNIRSDQSDDDDIDFIINFENKDCYAYIMFGIEDVGDKAGEVFAIICPLVIQGFGGLGQVSFYSPTYETLYTYIQNIFTINNIINIK